MIEKVKLSLFRPCGHKRGADVALPIFLSNRWRQVVKHMLRPQGKCVQDLFSRMGEPQKHSGHFEEEKYLWALPIKPEMVQPAAYSLYFAITHHKQNIITKERKQCH